MMDHSSKALLAGATTRSLRVTSIGECMVELAPASEVGQFRQGFAGDTFNTLWYLRQVCPAWNARFFSRVGPDQISQDMLDMMSGVGVDIGHIQRSPDRTVGLYLISLKDGERSFSYWRSQSAARQLADDPDLAASAMKDADIVFFSGITLAILSPKARTVLLQELSRARDAGKTIAFDPNLRPRLWQNARAMRDAIMAGAGVSDIVLPSFEEEAEHFGDADFATTSARYGAAGVRMVVVKNGPEPVHYLHRGRSGLVTPEPATKIVDTTSAGDSFNAGLFAGLAHYATIEDAIRFACRVAHQVIGQKGALGTLDLSQMEII